MIYLTSCSQAFLGLPLKSFVLAVVFFKKYGRTFLSPSFNLLTFPWSSDHSCRQKLILTYLLINSDDDWKKKIKNFANALINRYEGHKRTLNILLLNLCLSWQSVNPIVLKSITPLWLQNYLPSWFLEDSNSDLQDFMCDLTHRYIFLTLIPISIQRKILFLIHNHERSNYLYRKKNSD